MTHRILSLGMATLTSLVLIVLAPKQMVWCFRKLNLERPVGATAPVLSWTQLAGVDRPPPRLRSH